MQAQNFGATVFDMPQEREFPVQCMISVLSRLGVNQSLVNGTASFTITGANAGDYIINATYDGDNNYARITKLGKYSVYKNIPSIDLSFNTTDESVDMINSIVVGDQTVLIIKLPDDVNGYVNITVNETIKYNNKDLTDGKVNITLKDLEIGE